MLAVFTDAVPTLNLALLANDHLGIVSTGNSYILSLGASHTWSGTNDANVTGNGTSTLTVTAAGITAFNSTINISDSGSTGGDSIVFNNSEPNGYFLGDGPSGYANNFVIALTHSTSGWPRPPAWPFQALLSLPAEVESPPLPTVTSSSTQAPALPPAAARLVSRPRVQMPR